MAKGVRCLLAVGAILALLGCSDSPDAPAPSVSGAIELPPRRPGADLTVPDSCEILRDAEPAAIFDSPMVPRMRIYGLCIFDVAGWTPGSREPERTAQLEIRRADERGVPTDLKTFWAAEGAGVELSGGREPKIEELKDLADYSLWVPITDGLRLYAYWDSYILLFTIRGAATERALPWAQEVVRASMRASRAQGEPEAPRG